MSQGSQSCFYRDIWGSFLKENQTKIVYGRTYLCIYYSSTKKSSLKSWLSQAKFILRESEAIFENTSAWYNQGPRWVKLSKKIIGG